MKTFIVALKLFILMTVLVGVVYPLVITGITQAIFPRKANGSLVYMNDRVVGSDLIGQKFESQRYFWPRPSAIDYNPLPSGGSNLGPTSADLEKQISQRRSMQLEANGMSEGAIIPLDLLFTSASGLDPHISPLAARFQVNRIARARGFDANGENELYKLIDKHIEPRALQLMGEPRVNVLKLNLALDSLGAKLEIK
ncbi:MAG TPA: potassium-transporting ATPase subunit KdpC [Terriglobales bacterium]|nr:potassium-transporting ATPase subunit KdpC [Terriglobales bacterium]